MYLITRTAKFKRAYKLAVRRGLNMSKLNEVIGLLAMGEPLPARCRDHELVGRHVGKRECHVAPDANAREAALLLAGMTNAVRHLRAAAFLGSEEATNRLKALRLRSR